MDRLADVDQGVGAPAARIAIVGGGWAGLACAVELSAAGLPVRVFEAAKQLGGRARRVEVEGRALDTMALVGLIGRGAMGWDGLLADQRYGAAQSRLLQVRETSVDVGASSGAIDVGNTA